MPPRLRFAVFAAWIAFGLVPCAIAAAQPVPATTPAATAPGTRPPKICLVLSGGGARGAAHVGVLKVLEEYRVPIHCIAGTSMGSLVGAAYATGMTVGELEQINATISTELLFRETPPRQERSMRSKQDDQSILVGPEFGIKDGELRFPKGLITGVQLESVLRRLSRATGYHHFDDLPIPFRAMATDLVTGRAVTFSEGELANVMRASMSVPGAVAPAEFGRMMLVDGGLTNNLPVAVARTMGADVVIAVNVGTPLLGRDQLTGILGVTGQMISILTEQNVQASLALLGAEDILITPELGDFSAADFDNLPRIAPLGESAARKVAARLARLSVPEAEYAALRQRRQVATSADTRPVDEIRFEGLQRVNPRAAQSAMETRAGATLDQQTLDRDMRRIMGSRDFEHVNYRFLEESGKRVLAVEAVEKSWGPDYLRFGLGLSSDFGGDSYFNLLVSYRRTWLNRLGAEWRTDLQVGHTSSAYTEFYQPLDAEDDLFIAPHARVERRSQNLYAGNDRVARYETTSRAAGVDVGLQFRRYGELRLGVVGGAADPRLDTGPQELSPGGEQIALGALTARLVFDQLDSALFPRNGLRVGMSVYNARSALGAPQPYAKWDIDGSAAYSFGPHTLNLALKAGGRLGPDPLPRYDQFSWGGFLQQSGYSTGQLAGDSLKFGRLMYYHRILQGSLFEGAYSGVSFEAGKVGNPLVPGNPTGWLRSASLFVAADTPIGPVYVAWGRAADGQSSSYFYLGRPF